MPAGRIYRYKPKRKYTRRARRVAKRSFARSVIRAVANRQIYPFKRFTFKASIGGTDGAGAGFGYSFKLSEIPNHTEFTALFDQYKIAGIKYRWVINRNPDFGGTVVTNVYNTTVQGQYPRIMWVHDFDSDNAPANFAELQQYPKMKEVYLTPDKPYTKWFFLKPARLDVGFENAANSSYHPQWRGFVDMASDTTPYYGIRGYYDGLNNNVQLRLECWYMFVCKNVR